MNRERVIFDGRKEAHIKRQQIKSAFLKIKAETKTTPRLVSLRIGDDTEAQIYARVQKKEAQKTGIEFSEIKFPSSASEKELLRKIRELNKKQEVHGIFVHQPFAKHLNGEKIVQSISFSKDVEGIHPLSLGKLFRYSAGKSSIIIPPTAASILYILKKSKIPLMGKDVLIIGHSEIVGKPIALLLLNELATVTVSHIATFKSDKLIKHIKDSDIIISAVGKPCLIKGEWINEGSCLIDVGISQTDEGIKGDIEFEKALKKAAFITPVPGGVGPLTVLFLMQNLLTLFKRHIYGKEE